MGRTCRRGPPGPFPPACQPAQPPDVQGSARALRPSPAWAHLRKASEAEHGCLPRSPALRALRATRLIGRAGGDECGSPKQRFSTGLPRAQMPQRSSMLAPAPIRKPTPPASAILTPAAEADSSTPAVPAAQPNTSTATVPSAKAHPATLTILRVHRIRHQDQHERGAKSPKRS